MSVLQGSPLTSSEEWNDPENDQQNVSDRWDCCCWVGVGGKWVFPLVTPDPCLSTRSLNRIGSSQICLEQWFLAKEGGRGRQLLMFAVNRLCSRAKNISVVLGQVEKGWDEICGVSRDRQASAPRDRQVSAPTARGRE